MRETGGAAAKASTPLGVVFRWVAIIALVTPWLNPFAGGPSPAVIPWLVSSACACVFVLMALAVRVDSDSVPAAAWLAAALLSSVIGLLQYFGVSASFAPWINTTLAGEAYANLRQRNQFASLTNIGLPALVYWASHRALVQDSRNSSQDRQELPRGRAAAGWHQSWPMAAALLLAAGNAASSSRTGIVQLAMLWGLVVCWRRYRRGVAIRILGVATLGYAIAAFALPRLAGLDPSATGILARLNESGLACTSRLTLWSNVLHLIAQKPWTGWGWGELDYAHFTTLYPGARFCDILDNAHNLPLHLAVELGTPVAVLASALGLWLIGRARPWADEAPARQLAWAVLAVILLHSMLEYPMWYGPFQISAGLCVWLLGSTRRTARRDTGGIRTARAGAEGAPMRIDAALAACAALLLLAGLAYAAWDYRRISQIYRAPEMRSAAYRVDTLEKIRDSRLFRNQVLFAELTTTDVRIDNAATMNAMAHELLHFSPEARVAEKVIESAYLLDRDDEMHFYELRYRAAFPKEFAQWAALKGFPP